MFSGGSVSEADLVGYTVRERAPLHCGYRGLSLVAMPPPSSGGVAVYELLGVLQRRDLAAMGWHGAAEVHVLAEAMRHVFFDRNTYLNDSDFVADPLDWLLSPSHLDGIALAIGPRAMPTATLRRVRHRMSRRRPPRSWWWTRRATRSLSPTR